MAFRLEPELRAQMLVPPRLSADVPGIASEGGGRIKARPEDFVVSEELAYEASGEGPQLLFTMTKRGLNTNDAVARLARHCAVPKTEIGVAGLKDKQAVTTQWVSVPAHRKAQLESFSDPDIRLGPATLHGNKIKRGHARANHFAIVVRGVHEDWAARLDAKRARLASGVPNGYGAQRFGHEGRNLEAGLAWLARGGRGKRLPSVVANAGQSGLFNAYLHRRCAQVGAGYLAGDVMQTSRGGLFSDDDDAAIGERFGAGEIAVTGPIYGAKMPWPRADSPSEALELALLREIGMERDSLQAAKRISGSRRPTMLPAMEIQATAEGADEGLDAGVRLEFALPAGAYATILLAELLGDG